MRIIHCADVHLDARMTAHLTKEQARMRKSELLHTFERMVQYAADNDVRAILIAGDLFDTKTVSATARNAVCQAIAGHPEIDFFYLKGNHDADGFLAEMKLQSNEQNSLPVNLHLFGEAWTSYVLNPGEKVRIVLTGAELAGGGAQALYQGLTLSRDDFNIVTLHGQESAYGKDKQAEVIDLRLLKDKGIDYLALGHVHAYKSARLDARGVYCYSGCLEGRGFDECGAHGFVLLDIDGESGQMTQRFIPFAKRTLYTVHVDVSDCMQSPQMLAQVQCALADMRRTDALTENDMVKIILTGALDVDCEKDLLYLQRQLEGNFFVVKLEDQTSLKVDDQAYALDESLKGEFVRTVMAAQELSEEEKAAIVRYGIQALAGELEL